MPQQQNSPSGATPSGVEGATGGPDAASGGVGGLKKSRSGGDIGEGPTAAKQRVIVQPPSPVDEGFGGGKIGEKMT